MAGREGLLSRISLLQPTCGCIGHWSQDWDHSRPKPPLILLLDLDCKLNTTAELRGENGIFMRHCALGSWAAHKPGLASKSPAKLKELPYTDPSVLVLSVFCRRSVWFTLGFTTPEGLHRHPSEGLDSDPGSRGISYPAFLALCCRISHTIKSYI